MKRSVPRSPTKARPRPWNKGHHCGAHGNVKTTGQVTRRRTALRGWSSCRHSKGGDHFGDNRTGTATSTFVMDELVCLYFRPYEMGQRGE